MANLAASQRNAGTAVQYPMAAGLPPLSSWDNAALENIARNASHETYEFPAHARKTFQSFARAEGAKER